jgi:hypothetical protein
LKKIAEKWREKMMHKRVQQRKSWLLQKGIYTQQAQSMAHYLASSGMAEEQVEGALQAIGKAFGLDIPRNMSQQAVLEGGIAADIQLGYEMISAKSKYSFI